MTINSNSPNNDPASSTGSPPSVVEGNPPVGSLSTTSPDLTASPLERSTVANMAYHDPPGIASRLYLAGTIVGAVVLTLVGLLANNPLLTLVGTAVSLFVCFRVVWQPFRRAILRWLSEQENIILLGSIGGLVALLGVFKLLRFDALLVFWYEQANWDAVGALGEVFGALGQILIAILAVYIAWRQYVIEKDLTTQQNIITQQQTIDSYFQGISDLVLDDEGLLEDWPQERAIAEGRTAAILSSIDGGGKAKVIRFLSRARLLTPLKRDQRLGRAILDGTGGYEEDRLYGTRVIDLGVMLAGANLANTDLRWTDLSDINLIRANLSYCDLVKTNFSRTILVRASLRGADLQGTRFFYGKSDTASPRSRTVAPDYTTGEHTGAVIEDADFTEVQDMSAEQRYYCCAWGGSRTRNTIPGGCEGIPNKLGR